MTAKAAASGCTIITRVEADLLDMKAPIGIIFAGGRNTRLKPITNHTPKALLPITPDGATMLDRAIYQMRGAGIEDIKALVAPHWECDLPGIEVIKDQEEGLIPALYNVLNNIKEREIVVMNVDFVCVRNPVKQVMGLEPPAALWDRIGKPGNYGVMVGDAVVYKPHDEYIGCRALLGVWYYPREIFSLLGRLMSVASYPFSMSDIDSAYRQAGLLACERIDAAWVDAGTHDGLAEASKSKQIRRTKKIRAARAIIRARLPRISAWNGYHHRRASRNFWTCRTKSCRAPCR